MPLTSPQQFRNCNLLVIGDYMLDEYIHGAVDRISPEAPVPVVIENRREYIAGGAGNVVRNLKALGAGVFGCGLIGSDEAGESLINIFKKLETDDGVDGLVIDDKRPTTRKTRIMAGNQQVCRLDKEVSGLINKSQESRLLEYILSVLPKVQGVIFSDYDKGVITPTLIEKVVSVALEKNIFIAVDPQVSHFLYYQKVNILTPNNNEAGRFLGRKIVTDSEIESAGEEILKKLNAQMLLLTRGDRGMTLFDSRDNSFRHFPTIASEVFDVTGAGDTVISIFTLAMAAGLSVEEAVHLSNRGAGIVIGRLGAATVTAQELIE